MKIIYFGPDGAEKGVFSLLTGLRNIGHQVHTCNFINIDNIRKAAKEAIEQFKPDAALTIGGWYAKFDAESLWDVIKKYNLPHIYWAIEDPTFFDWASTKYLDSYDFVFSVSEICVPVYEALGVPSSYLSYCCNPSFHRTVEADQKYKNDIIVASNKYMEIQNTRCRFRNLCFRDMVRPVLESGYDIKIYGKGWERQQPPIPGEKLGGYVPRTIMPVIYSSAKIVLSIQWDRTGHICYKTYEALGCGCFQIAPRTPLLEKYFKEGIHMAFTDSAEETLQLADYYLKHDKVRKMIAQKGREEACINHSCDVRAGEFVRVLKKSGLI